MTRWWLFQSCNRLNTRNTDTVYQHVNGCETGKIRLNLLVVCEIECIRSIDCFYYALNMNIEYRQ